MALSVNQVWEVRTTGSDTNGGAFRAGSAGTDYSVQDAAQVAVADAVANGTTTITSATAAFVAGHAGNVIYLAGGSGSLAATRREVISVTNATTIVVDAAVASGTGITLNLGGALLTLGELASSTRGMVASNKAFIKSGTYGVTAGVNFGQNIGNPNQAQSLTELVGYYQARGDVLPGVNAANRPTIQTNAAGLTALNFSGQGWYVRNLVVGAGSSTPATGLSTTGAFVAFDNCAVTAYSTWGILANGATACAAHGCEVSGGIAGATGGIEAAGSGLVCGCYVHDGLGGAGIYTSNAASVVNNVVSNMQGATGVGISCGNYGAIFSNTVYKSGSHGIAVTTIDSGTLRIQGNILANNGGYGLACTAGAGTPARRQWDGNAFWSNTSGNRSNFDDTTVNAANGVAPYTNTLDVACTASPFTNAAGGDFTLNGTAGGGAALRGAGPFNGYPGLSQTGYRDFGPFQHRDSGSTITNFIEG